MAGYGHPTRQVMGLINRFKRRTGLHETMRDMERSKRGSNIQKKESTGPAWRGGRMPRQQHTDGGVNFGLGFFFLHFTNQTRCQELLQWKAREEAGWMLVRGSVNSQTRDSRPGNSRIKQCLGNDGSGAPGGNRVDAVWYGNAAGAAHTLGLGTVGQAGHGTHHLSGTITMESPASQMDRYRKGTR